jgi:hypothetical protein
MLKSYATSLRLLSDRRDDLVARRTQVLKYLHALLTDLVPGAVPAHFSAATAAALPRRRPTGRRPAIPSIAAASCTVWPAAGSSMEPAVMEDPAYRS